MKVFAVLVLLAVVSGAAAGSVVAWPGGKVLASSPNHLTHAAISSVVVPQTKFFGFSSTQYINTIPSALPVALQPHVHYQVPQLSPFAPLQHTTFYPVAGGSYFPGSVIYPPFTITPAPGYPAFAPAPGQPAGFPQGTPGFPSQEPSIPQGSPFQDTPSQAGDSDTTVVDSAEYPQQDQDKPQNQPQDQSTSTPAPQQEQSSAPQFPPIGNYPFPTLPSLPQAPQGEAPSFPSFPQFPQGSLPQFPQEPSFPQFPQGSLPQFPQGSLPQFPQGSLPQFPQFPQLPQFPSSPSTPQSPTSSPPSSFPGGSSNDKGLNDEDTISVESA